MLMSTSASMLATASRNAGCVTETETAKTVQMKLTVVSRHLLSFKHFPLLIHVLLNVRNLNATTFSLCKTLKLPA